jgi:tetrahydromethanopterin S-methyltransferase subunit G
MTNNTQGGGPGPMMNSNDHFAKVLDKLTDSFDDFKERLIRIEESVKTVNEVKQDVGLMALKVQGIEESAKSAHKRLDTLERDVAKRLDDMEKETVTKVEHSAMEKRVQSLERIVFWVSTLIIGSVILTVLGLVYAK